MHAQDASRRKHVIHTRASVAAASLQKSGDLEVPPNDFVRSVKSFRSVGSIGARGEQASTGHMEMHAPFRHG